MAPAIFLMIGLLLGAAGHAIRVAGRIKSDFADKFGPLLAPMVVGLVWVLYSGFSWIETLTVISTTYAGLELFRRLSRLVSGRTEALLYAGIRFEREFMGVSAKRPAGAPHEHGEHGTGHASHHEIDVEEQLEVDHVRDRAGADLAKGFRGIVVTEDHSSFSVQNFDHSAEAGEQADLPGTAEEPDE
jgi:hypothetical protein